MACPSIRPDAEISGATGGSETIPKWGFGQKYIYNDLDAQTDQVQDFGRTMAHPSPPSDAEFSGAMAGSRSDLIFNDRGHFVTQQHQSSPLFQGESQLIPQSTWSHPFPRGARSPPFPRGTRSPPFLQGTTRSPSPPFPRGTRSPSFPQGTVRSPPFLAGPSRSPPLDFQNNHHVDSRTLDESQWPSLSLYKSGNSSQSFQNFPNQLPQTMTPSNPTNYDPGRKSPVKHTDQVSKRSRSPPGSPPSGATFGLHQPKRPSTSPSISRSNGPPDSLAPQSSSINAEVGVSKPMYFPVSKRTKVPSVPSSDQVLQDDNDIQRETEAKAKRLARFKDDLNRTVQEDSKRQNQSVVVERQKIGVEDSTDDDYDGSEPAGVIIGSCPDMCPESEREERERKGDLDRYERVGGDRNQSSKLLAVKKYNRTAEREAILIRPMPILQKTMDYLLNLLDKPYDDTFLTLYNFLWDRMRAIRMDLRMQHIFNLEAMNMLEQMIRLHIIAMHELCEYTRGEGFSEGFDGHLNIEQMNKTSVELFQIYDDHRKRGINVATEREFRGYYALLKLDKHPGYKVEPAELSLDLAKMTPVMRQTPEVLFARDVARACRAGNFIAFFRLARRASYLQACLMHAHFSKLRTQALASLHSGLQNGQGIPVSQVAKWLGMEEEDIEGLVEYYGFSIKEFEEAYMVKEGPFLEVDNDYPVKCSKLVHKKKSKSMFEDVSAAHVELESKNETELLLLDKDHQQKHAAVEFLEPDDTSRMVIEEDMPDYEIISSPQDEIRTVPITQTEFSQKTRYEGPHVPPSNSVSSLQVPPSPSLFFPRSSPEAQQQAKNDEVSQFHAQVMSVDLIPAVDDQEEGLPLFPSDFPVEDEELRNTSDEDEEMLAVTGEGADNIEVAASYYDEEVAEAKLRLIIRIWKRRSSKIREMHEQKQLASKAALSSLSLGVPMWPNKAQHGTSVELNIDHAVSKWYQAQERSWSRLNVSDVVASTLHERNPAAKCLCWKVILFCHEIQEDGVEQLNAKSWLLSKLMPTRGEEHDTLISSPGLSIWRNWFFDQPAGDRICCLSVVKYTNFENLNGTVAGASAVVFLLTDGIRLDLQKNQLHKLLMSVPCCSDLPLLILTEVCEENADASTIVKELELHPAHESRLGSISVVFLKKQQLLSDEQLRGGLKWLASESPPQPLLQCVKPRELVLYHLHSLLGEMNSHDVGPNNCISAFNEALDESMREIVSAAHANPTCWPCPEISLLEESSQEHHAVTQHLPKAGWSLAPTIEPIVWAINDCKLPSLIDDMSWLYRGSDVVAQQILQLEDCLINYFTESELSLAKEEASVVLQKSVQLRLNSSHYYIVPNWVKIFGRAFNWKLNKLAEGGTSFPVYTLIQHDFARELKNSEELHNQLLHPSLDEMVQVATLKDVPTTVCAGDAMEYWQDIGRDDEFVRTSDNYVKEFVKTSDDNVKNSEKGPLLVTEETDKLSKLLEKCEIKQNRIGKGLSIYF